MKTGVSWQEPDPTPIMTRNCSGTALNGLMLLKFVVPAGKSSKVKVTTYVPDAPSPPLYVKMQFFCKAKYERYLIYMHQAS